MEYARQINHWLQILSSLHLLEHVQKAPNNGLNRIAEFCDFMIGSEVGAAI